MIRRVPKSFAASALPISIVLMAVSSVFMSAGPVRADTLLGGPSVAALPKAIPRVKPAPPTTEPEAVPRLKPRAVPPRRAKVKPVTKPAHQPKTTETLDTTAPDVTKPEGTAGSDVGSDVGGPGLLITDPQAVMTAEPKQFRAVLAAKLGYPKWWPVPEQNTVNGTNHSIVRVEKTLSADGSGYTTVQYFVASTDPNEVLRDWSARILSANTNVRAGATTVTNEPEGRKSVVQFDLSTTETKTGYLTLTVPDAKPNDEGITISLGSVFGAPTVPSKRPPMFERYRDFPLAPQSTLDFSTVDMAWQGDQLYLQTQTFWKISNRPETVSFYQKVQWPTRYVPGTSKVPVSDADPVTFPLTIDGSEATFSIFKEFAVVGQISRTRRASRVDTRIPLIKDPRELLTATPSRFKELLTTTLDFPTWFPVPEKNVLNDAGIGSIRRIYASNGGDKNSDGSFKLNKTRAATYFSPQKSAAEALSIWRAVLTKSGARLTKGNASDGTDANGNKFSALRFGFGADQPNVTQTVELRATRVPAKAGSGFAVSIEFQNTTPLSV